MPTEADVLHRYVYSKHVYKIFWDHARYMGGLLRRRWRPMCCTEVYILGVYTLGFATASPLVLVVRCKDRHMAIGVYILGMYTRSFRTTAPRTRV